MSEPAGLDLRERIVSAALDLFALRGYSTVGVADIADYAQLTQGTVIELFAGKDRLLDEVLSPTVESIDRTLGGGAEPTGGLTGLVVSVVGAIADAGPRVAALLDDPAVGEKVYADARSSALLDRIEHALTQELARGMDCEPTPPSIARTALRMRSAAAVAATPAAIAAWTEVNPATPVIDDEARDTLTGIVLAIITQPTRTRPAP